MAYDEVSQVLINRVRYEQLDSNQEVKKVWYRELKLRFVTVEEMRLQLTLAGFNKITVRSGFLSHNKIDVDKNVVFNAVKI